MARANHVTYLPCHNFSNYITSLTALLAIYISASIVDLEVNFYYYKAYNITLLYLKINYPITNFLLFSIAYIKSLNTLYL